jgi:hypothetical protein
MSYLFYRSPRILFKQSRFEKEAQTGNMSTAFYAVTTDESVATTQRRGPAEMRRQDGRQEMRATKNIASHEEEELMEADTLAASGYDVACDSVCEANHHRQHPLRVAFSSPVLPKPLMSTGTRAPLPRPI